MLFKRTIQVFSLILILSLLAGSNLTAHAQEPAPVKYVQLAWFYKPPADGDLSLLAQHFSTFILTRTNEDTRDQLTALGASAPMLEYIRFDAIQDPGGCTLKPYQNQAASLPGDFCSISKKHKSWFLLSSKGKRLFRTVGNYRYYLMDPGNAGWRAFFLSRLKTSLESDPKWQGVFLDNMEMSLNFHKQAGNKLKRYTTDAKFQAAVMGMLSYLRQGYFAGSGKILSGNVVSRQDDTFFTDAMASLDGAMHEGWAIDSPNRWRPAADWEKHMALAEQAQAAGKFIILVSHGEQNDLELQNFAYASYLLITNGKASFRYGSDEAYNQAWLYPNYDLPIGTPLGPRYQNGTAWQRDFSNGTVTVDPLLHTAEITVIGP